VLSRGRPANREPRVSAAVVARDAVPRCRPAAAERDRVLRVATPSLPGISETRLRIVVGARQSRVPARRRRCRSRPRAWYVREWRSCGGRVVIGPGPGLDGVRRPSVRSVRRALVVVAVLLTCTLAGLETAGAPLARFAVALLLGAALAALPRPAEYGASSARSRCWSRCSGRASRSRAPRGRRHERPFRATQRHGRAFRADGGMSGWFERWLGRGRPDGNRAACTDRTHTNEPKSRGGTNAPCRHARGAVVATRSVEHGARASRRERRCYIVVVVGGTLIPANVTKVAGHCVWSLSGSCAA